MKKIIIIDDDKKSIENLELMCKIKLKEFETVLFQYPDQFIKAKIAKPSLIILDIMFAGDGEHLGGFNMGLEFYIEYKKLNPKIHILIFTNKTKESIGKELIKIIEHYNDLIIEKPTVSMERFILIIKDLLHINSNEFI